MGKCYSHLLVQIEITIKNEFFFVALEKIFELKITSDDKHKRKHFFKLKIFICLTNVKILQRCIRVIKILQGLRLFY